MRIRMKRRRRKSNYARKDRTHTFLTVSPQKAQPFVIQSKVPLGFGRVPRVFSKLSAGFVRVREGSWGFVRVRDYIMHRTNRDKTGDHVTTISGRFPHFWTTLTFSNNIFMNIKCVGMIDSFLNKCFSWFFMILKKKLFVKSVAIV